MLLKALLPTLMLWVSEACMCSLIQKGDEYTCEPETCTEASSIIIYGSTATKINMRTVTAVYANIAITGNSKLNTLTFPKLSKVQGNITVTGNPNLLSFPLLDLNFLGGSASFDCQVGFPELTDVRGELKVSSKFASMLDLPKLNHVDSLVIFNNPSLAKLSAPKLDRTTSISLVNNPKLSIVELGAISHVADTFELDTSAVKQVVMNSLITLKNFHVRSNSVLTLVSVKNMTTCSNSFSVKENSNLTDVKVERLRNVDYFVSTGLTKHGCVSLECLQPTKHFEASWCGHVNTSAPLCTAGVTWVCSC